VRTSTWLAAGIALSLASLPLTANADELVTLSYQSALLTGSYSYLPTGLSDSALLPSSPFTGTLSGSVLFDETTLALNGVVSPISYDLELMGSGGLDIGFGSTAPIFLFDVTSEFEAASCAGSSNNICVITQNGVITAASVGLVSNFYHSPPTQLSIGPQGDSAFYQFATTMGTCENYQLTFDTGSTYTGNTISPCVVQASSATAGKWTVSSTNAPEIDPGFAGSGLTLLAGCLAILRGRRRGAD
jgi:hypothetical protein